MQSEEELLTLKEFAHLFQRNVTALQRKAKSGRWKQAERVAGQWYVVVPTRLAQAARNRYRAAA